MAIPRAIGKLMIDLAEHGGWSGSVLQLGRQTVYVTESELARGFTLSSRFGTFADDHAFFRRLGFSDVHSSDLMGIGGAEHVLDLNEPIPESFHGAYDAVYEGGTIACVFDVPQALRNVERLLKPGGRVIHTMMSNGYVDEGLYAISPRLLLDWYEGRGWSLEVFVLLEHDRRWARGRMRGYRYHRDALSHLNVADLERGALLSVVVATRPAEPIDRIPYLTAPLRSGRLMRVARTPLGRRLVAIVRPVLPSRVIRFVPRRMPPRTGTW